MGRSWQANWAMTKIYMSNLRKHVMNKCWKFQADILIHIWSRAKRLICCNQWTPKEQIRPASHGPFQPKLWMPLATIFVEIFQKEKKWWGSGPIGVTSWKDFSISLKKWRFEIFRTSSGSTFTMSTIYQSQINKTEHAVYARRILLNKIVLWISRFFSS